jgi:hypothetical protein
MRGGVEWPGQTGGAAWALDWAWWVLRKASAARLHRPRTCCPPAHWTGLAHGSSSQFSSHARPARGHHHHQREEGEANRTSGESDPLTAISHLRKKEALHSSISTRRTSRPACSRRSNERKTATPMHAGAGALEASAAPFQFH